ncbi:flavodoxin family protein [Candidatus Woesearchaeota archaeon]|nr:flavodoxin family protein [Candidatus Woesearchaeota archaeon]
MIVGISGSPKDGNNNAVMRKILDSFENSELIRCDSVKVAPCIACNYCASHDHCVQSDDGNKVNEKLAKADAIIISSPVYFGSMTGQLKCLFDRTLPLRRNGFKLKGKIGAAVAVGGSRSGGQELTIKDIHAWMLIHAMVIVGDNNHFGGTVHVPYSKDSFGEETVEGTIFAVESLLRRLKC